MRVDIESLFKIRILDWTVRQHIFEGGWEDREEQGLNWRLIGFRRCHINYEVFYLRWRCIREEQNVLRRDFQNAWTIIEFDSLISIRIFPNTAEHIAYVLRILRLSGIQY